MANVFTEGLQQKHRGATHQHKAQQHKRQDQIQLRQAAHPFVQPGSGRQGCQPHHAHNHADAKCRGAGVPPRHQIQARSQLHGPIAQRGRQARNRAHQGKRIHPVANRAVDAVLQQGVQARAHGQRQVVAKAEVGQRQAHHTVNGPGVKAPVKEGGHQRLLGRARRACHLGGWIQVMLQRLTNAKVHQANAHARSKQHGRPRYKAELRLGIVRAEADIAIAADRQQHQKQQKQRDDDGVEPVKMPHHPGLGAGEHAVGQRGKSATQHQQRHQHQQSGHHHRG